jgi:hypothetical protein
VHVEARADAGQEAAAQQRLGAGEVVRLGDFQVALAAGHKRDVEAGGGGGDGAVVGERLARTGTVRGQNRVESEALRRLHAHAAGAVDLAQHQPALGALERVGHRQGRQDRRRARFQPVEHAVHQGRIEQGPGAVVDQHPCRRERPEALQPDANRILAFRPARHRLQQIEAGSRLVVEFAIVGVDHCAHRVHAGVLRQRSQTLAQQRPTGKARVSLRARAAETRAAAGGDDEGDGREALRHGARR